MLYHSDHTDMDAYCCARCLHVGYSEPCDLSCMNTEEQNNNAILEFQMHEVVSFMNIMK